MLLATSNTTRYSLLFIVFFLGIFSQQSSAQKAAEYKKRIDLIDQNIHDYFYDSSAHHYKEFDKPQVKDNPYSYLWPLCGLIQAANEVETIMPKMEMMAGVLQNIYAYADDAPPAPAYASYVVSEKKESRFYDDNQWVSIACMDAYKRTKQKNYLEEGEKIYRFMMTGYDTVSGGGLYWKEDERTTKNTCSNGPGILVALELYKATKQKAYLDTALLLYNWVNDHLRSANNLYYDNIKIPSMEIDKRFYTYNSGSMIQSAVILYEITHDKQYLQQARQAAEMAYNQFYKNERWPGNYWFNAVLLRAYIALNKYDKEKKYINAFITDADAIWQTERDNDNMIGKKTKKQLIDQAAMMEIYSRLVPFVR